MAINNIVGSTTSQVLSINNATQENNTDKLSSGYKVNRNDDAVSLKITSKFASENVSENSEASMSSIHDIDKVDEMIANAQKNILANADDAVAAQANQGAAGVISLVQ